MITPEYLKAVRERALKNNPTGKVEPGCTCASCARLILLDEVERLMTAEVSPEVSPGPGTCPTCGAEVV